MVISLKYVKPKKSDRKEHILRKSLKRSSKPGSNDLGWYKSGQWLPIW